MHTLTRRHVIGLVAAAAPLFAASLSVALEKAPLAIKGYDPVAYFTENRPMVGEPQYQYEWDGALYRFASAKHLDLFKADPDRYLPQYNSLCVASLAKGVKYEGNPEYWLVADGRLYLFGAPVGATMMKSDPAAMTRKAEENWPKVSQALDPRR